MLSLVDHPMMQHIDTKIDQHEHSLSKLQVERIKISKELMSSTYNVARLICQNLNIVEHDRSVALLCGYEYLSNIQIVEQWLLEQLVELNQSYFTCPVSELQNRFLMRLNSLQQDAFLY
ncbi:hypothetical protein [Psychromonas sp. KJ10-2]|uniref:hypothetical protein n=1 Tax=Psychromonas sp. KJ10-2 TaxID=3391822 RepID=UPI0039B3EC53